MINYDSFDTLIIGLEAWQPGPVARIVIGGWLIVISKTMNTPIKSYRDLEVYQNTYQAAIMVIKQILPKLPIEEKYDLADQLRRSVKAIPRLIAEGYGKKDQVKGFQKYLDDAMSECNETVVGLSQCRDIYSPPVDAKLCDRLIDIYDKSGKQLYRLKEAWNNFKFRKPNNQ